MKKLSWPGVSLNAKSTGPHNRRVNDRYEQLLKLSGNLQKLADSYLRMTNLAPLAALAIRRWAVRRGPPQPVL